MRLILACLFALMLAPVTSAQDLAKVFVEVDEDTTPVGQPLVVRVTVVVPTWMPKPPVFADLEVPGLLVRLPERASSPTSLAIDGDTWSGVQRNYRLYPLAPGRYDIPRQTIRVTYAEPGGIEPVEAEVPFEGLTILAVVPQAARGLDPLIIASDFMLEATVDGGADLAVGGAVTRILTARINGTTPILIPALSPEVDPALVRTYPDEPSVAESEDGGTLSGSRTERVSYVATAAGAFHLPAVTFDWYNIDSGKVETATVEGSQWTIADVETSDRTVSRSPEALLRYAVIAAAVLLLGYLFWRYVRPGLQTWAARVGARWRASEPRAHLRVLAAIRSRDLDACFARLTDWADRHPGIADSDRQAVRTALAGIGATRFSCTAQSRASDGWSDLRLRYNRLRQDTLKRARDRRRHPGLPPLNPSAD